MEKENFIKEFNFSEEDMPICDALIEYHKNNMEYKYAGRSIGANSAKKSTDVTVYPASQNPLPWTTHWLSSKGMQVAPQETEVESYIVGGIKQDVKKGQFSKFKL